MSTKAEVISLRMRISLTDGAPGFESLFEELNAIHGDAKRRQRILRILLDYSLLRRSGRVEAVANVPPPPAAFQASPSFVAPSTRPISALGDDKDGRVCAADEPLDSSELMRRAAAATGMGW